MVQAGGAVRFDSSLIAVGEVPGNMMLASQHAFAPQSYVFSATMSIDPLSEGEQFISLGLFSSVAGVTETTFAFLSQEYDEGATVPPLFVVIGSGLAITSGDTVGAIVELDDLPPPGVPFEFTMSYDALAQSLAIDVPAAGLSLYIESVAFTVPALPALLVSATGHVGPLGGAPSEVPSRIVLDVDAVTSTFPAPDGGGGYSATLAPYMLDSIVYDDGIFGSPATIFFPSITEFVEIAADDTLLPQADGQTSYHVALITSTLGAQSTYITPLAASTLAALPHVLSVDGYLPDVYVAAGAGTDYTIDPDGSTPPPPPTPTTPPVLAPGCGLNCGSGGCSVPAAPIGDGSTQINLASGNLYHRVEVAGGGAPTYAAVVPSYNAQTPAGGPMGPGWTHSDLWGGRFDGETLTITGPTGAEIAFVERGGEWVPRDGCCNGDFRAAEFFAGGADLIEQGGMRWRFNDRGYLTQKLDTHGRVWSYSYRDDGRLAQTLDPYGRSTTFAYDGAGMLVAITDPAGHTAHFGYDGFGRMVTATDTRGEVERYAYDESDLLIQLTDKNGHPWGFAYDAQGRVTQVTDTLGHTTTVDYGPGSATVTDRRGHATFYALDPAQNVVVQMVDPRGTVTSYGYNAFGDRISTTDHLGNTEVKAYDLRHNVLAVTDALGGTESFTYNELDLATSQTDKNGGTATFAYDAAGNLLAQTDPLGLVRTFAYDADGNVVAAVDPLGHMRTYGYADGVLVAEYDELGHGTLYEVDALGRVVATVDAVGARTESELDPLGNEVRVEHEDGHVEFFVYDGMGNLVRTDVPGESDDAPDIAHMRHYDHNGEITAVVTFAGFVAREYTDAEGNVTMEVSATGEIALAYYDAAGDVTATADAFGIGQITQHDARGLIARTDEADGSVAIFGYDELGRTQSMALDDSVTLSFYDAHGNVTATSTDGRLTVHTFDANHRTIQSTDPEGHTVTFAYDDAGRKIAETDALGRTTVFVYDAAGREIERIMPSGAVWRSEYDPRGLKTAEIDPTGRRTTFVYDERGRQVARIDPAGGLWGTAYDFAGRVTATIDPVGAIEYFDYDADGRLIAHTDALGRVRGFSYDGDGRLTLVTEPDGTVRSNVFDERGLLIAHRDVAGDPKTEIEQIYDDAEQLIGYVDEDGRTRGFGYERGQLVAVTTPGGHTLSFEYAADKKLLAKTYAGGGRVDYVYDADNLLIAKILAGADAAETSEYVYDAAHQLIRRTATVEIAGEVETFVLDYAYDLDGRLAAAGVAGQPTVTYSWDGAGRRTRVEVAALGYRLDYGYDLNGNVTAITDVSAGRTWTFTYDAANRRTRTDYPDGSYMAFFYDAAGQVTREVARDALGATIFDERHSYDLRGNVVQTIAEHERRIYTVSDRDWLEVVEIQDSAGTPLLIQDLRFTDVGNIKDYDLDVQTTGARVEVFANPFDAKTWLRPEQDASVKVKTDVDDRLTDVDVSYKGGGGPGKPGPLKYAFTWDDAGNLSGVFVEDKGKGAAAGPDVEQAMLWTAENRLAQQSSSLGLDFVAWPLLEGEGLQQTTQRPLRSDHTGNEAAVVYDAIARRNLVHGDLTWIYGPRRDEVLAIVSANGTTYIYPNHRGDVLASRGPEFGQERRTYLATGMAVAPSLDGRPPLKVGLHGKELLATGWYEFNNRLLDPRLGQFVSSDPWLEGDEGYLDAEALTESDALAISQNGLSTFDGRAYGSFGANAWRAYDADGLLRHYSKSCKRKYKDLKSEIVKAKQFLLSSFFNQDRACLTDRWQRRMKNKLERTKFVCEGSLGGAFAKTFCFRRRIRVARDWFLANNASFYQPAKRRSTILHELVHNGMCRGERAAYNCAYKCSTSVGFPRLEAILDTIPPDRKDEAKSGRCKD